MPKKKSLADELADLFNPAPTKEFDPEADVFGQGPALEESDDELASAQPRKGKEAARLRGDIVLDGREYAGRRSSRAAVFGGVEGSDEDEEDEDEGGSGSESEELDGEEQPRINGGHGVGGSSSDDGGSDDDEREHEAGSGGQEEDDAMQAGAGWLGAAGEDGSSDEEPEAAAAGSGAAGRRAAHLAAAAADGELPSASEDGDEGSEDEGGRGGGTAAAAADDEMRALEREYEAMQEDEQAALAGLKERAAKERRKALAVQAQKAVWQRGLEARILLQRALAGANRLPQGDMAAVAASSAPDMAAAFAGLAADAAALAGELLQLLGALAGQNPAVGEAAAAAGVQPPSAPAAADAQQAAEQQGGQPPASEALWAQIEASYAGFAPFRDASIDRWHRKTMLTTGGAALRGGQLKALNQSVSTQVAQLMQDSTKVVQRARLARTAQQQPQHRVLCPDPDAPAPKRRRVDEEEDAKAETNGLEDERDPETFDDTEFYQTLLREFLEGSDAGGTSWQTGPKQRKAVDRRASKGRKLRYHVHEKLVNFMAPVELAAPQYAAQLFSNLFGGGGGAAPRA